MFRMEKNFHTHKKGDKIIAYKMQPAKTISSSNGIDRVKSKYKSSLEQCPWQGQVVATNNYTRYSWQQAPSPKEN